ncbi:hypothetical protein [Gemmatimonas sp.]|uniref:hypothetical protein n=1 Tax=Gemmatimonas sp. TaxID=1962908 RepID=UPI003DA1F297
MSYEKMTTVGHRITALTPTMAAILAALVIAWYALNRFSGVPVEVQSLGAADQLGITGKVNIFSFSMTAALYVLLCGISASSARKRTFLSIWPLVIGYLFFLKLRDFGNDSQIPTRNVVVLVMLLLTADLLISANARRLNGQS